MHPQTHYRSGRHIHNHGLDWRALRGQFDLMTELDYREDPRVEHAEDVAASYGELGDRRNVEAEHDGGQARILHTQQLDYLHTQLDSLKQNMVEKQSCLAHVRI